MNRTALKSSYLKSVGYDDKEKVLEVEFHDRAIFRYFGVGARTYRSLMSSKSRGAFFHTYIRDIYPNRRMTA